MRRVKLSPLRENSLLDAVADRDLPRVPIVQRSLFNSPLGTAFRSKSRRKEANWRLHLPVLPSHTQRSQSVQKAPLSKLSFSLRKQEANRVLYYFPMTAEKED